MSKGQKGTLGNDCGDNKSAKTSCSDRKQSQTKGAIRLGQCTDATKRANDRLVAKAVLTVLALLVIAGIWRALQAGQEQAEGQSLDEAGEMQPIPSEAASLNSEPTLSQSGQSEKHGEPVSKTMCPIPVGGEQTLYYSKGALTESWKYQSRESSKDLAATLLIELRDLGYELIKADYLDLYGKAWGCTVRSPDGETYVIAMIPKQLDPPDKTGTELEVSIVHILIPNIDVALPSDDG